MPVFLADDLSIHVEKKGLDRYEKLSYPIRYGTYTEIRNGSFVFQFNLNDEIRYIQCRSGTPMEPGEWLKRTVGNDWVYYASGGYNGAIDAVGEYYVPCFTYPSNPVLGGNPFKTGILDIAFQTFYQTLDEVSTLAGNSQSQKLAGIRKKNDPETLKKRADIFHRMIGGVISVLPPDARHVDYDVIPLAISEGCLYNCRFCTVKTGKDFSVIHRERVDEQIRNLKAFYGRDLNNRNSVFLGQHDALEAGTERIVHAAEAAYAEFGFSSSYIKGPRLFLFGSADSFLSAPDTLFRALSGLPYETFINLGLESVDGPTLERLGKPLTPEKVRDAFLKMKDINQSFPGVEITANFLCGDAFSKDHYDKMADLVRETYPQYYPKGAVYLSPYGRVRDRRGLVSGFKVMKNSFRLPVFLYIIQRL
jgi:hypothetical protein